MISATSLGFQNSAPAAEEGDRRSPVVGHDRHRVAAAAASNLPVGAGDHPLYGPVGSRDAVAIVAPGVSKPTVIGW